MAEDVIDGQTEENIQGNGKKIKCMEKEFLNGRYFFNFDK